MTFGHFVCNKENYSTNQMSVIVAFLFTLATPTYLGYLVYNQTATPPCKQQWTILATYQDHRLDY